MRSTLTAFTVGFALGSVGLWWALELRDEATGAVPEPGAWFPADL